MMIQAFGKLSSGQQASLITLTNSKGMQVGLCDYGARLVSILAPDRNGKLADVCLGFDAVSDYETRSGYLGATCGRFANRIGQASFSINGRQYKLFANNGAHSLHGGKQGFDSKIWQFETIGQHQVVFYYTARDGEEGYPGQLDCQVSYTLSEANALEISYEAISDQDTVLNLTNHAYFNLAGQGDIRQHHLQVLADHIVETDLDLIPSGRLAAVKGSPYDLREATLLGPALDAKTSHPGFLDAQGFDTCYVLGQQGFAKAALLLHQQSGRALLTETDQPGIQVYSGQGLSGAGKNGQAYGPYSGIALETQHFPDSPNQPSFPSTLLKAGQRFTSLTRYSFLIID